MPRKPTRPTKEQEIRAQLKTILNDSLDELIELVDENFDNLKDVVVPAKSVENLPQSWWDAEIPYMKQVFADKPWLTVKDFVALLRNNRQKASKGKGVAVKLEKLRVAGKVGDKEKVKDVKQELFELAPIQAIGIVEEATKASDFLGNLIYQTREVKRAKKELLERRTARAEKIINALLLTILAKKELKEKKEEYIDFIKTGLLGSSNPEISFLDGVMYNKKDKSLYIKVTVNTNDALTIGTDYELINEAKLYNYEYRLLNAAIYYEIKSTIEFISEMFRESQLKIWNSRKISDGKAIEGITGHRLSLFNGINTFSKNISGDDLPLKFYQNIIAQIYFTYMWELSGNNIFKISPVIGKKEGNPFVTLIDYDNGEEGIDYLEYFDDRIINIPRPLLPTEPYSIIPILIVKYLLLYEEIERQSERNRRVDDYPPWKQIPIDRELLIEITAISGYFMKYYKLVADTLTKEDFLKKYIVGPYTKLIDHYTKELYGRIRASSADWHVKELLDWHDLPSDFIPDAFSSERFMKHTRRDELPGETDEVIGLLNMLTRLDTQMRDSPDFFANRLSIIDKYNIDIDEVDFHRYQVAYDELSKNSLLKMRQLLLDNNVLFNSDINIFNLMANNGDRREDEEEPVLEEPVLEPIVEEPVVEEPVVEDDSGSEYDSDDSNISANWAVVMDI
tara:strand:+ start:38 stop:2074 length:2037 start_codon:yes stop_codon:yes gene_type:complete